MGACLKVERTRWSCWSEAKITNLVLILRTFYWNELEKFAWEVKFTFFGTLHLTQKVKIISEYKNFFVALIHFSQNSKFIPLNLIFINSSLWDWYQPLLHSFRFIRSNQLLLFRRIHICDVQREIKGICYYYSNGLYRVYSLYLPFKASIK
jgi:hypothetical protein